MFPVMAVDMGDKSSKGFLKNKFSKEICNKNGLDSHTQYIDLKCNSTFSHIKYLNSHKEQRVLETLSFFRHITFQSKDVVSIQSLDLRLHSIVWPQTNCSRKLIMSNISNLSFLKAA